MSSATWYNNWSFRKKITVTNAIATDLTDYSIEYTFDHGALVTAGHSSSDGSDLRFVGVNNNATLGFWIKSGVNTSTCIIVILIPSIPASKTIEIYMYYGNSGAESASDFNAAYYFADDFSSSNKLDRGRWSSYNGNGTWTEASGVFTLSCADGVDCNWWSGFTENAPFIYTLAPADNYEAITELHSYTVNVGSYAGIILYGDSDNVIFTGRYRSAGSNLFNTEKIIDDEGAGGGTYNSTTLPALLKIRKVGSNKYYYVSVDNGANWNQTYTSAEPLYLSENYVGLFAKNWDPFPAIVAPFDYFYIRKYASSEPTTSTGSEQYREDYKIPQRYGFAISNRGEDVLTTDEHKLSIISKYDSLRIFHTGRLEVRIPKFIFMEENQQYTWQQSWYFDPPLGYTPLVTPMMRTMAGITWLNTGVLCGAIGFEDCWGTIEAYIEVDTEKLTLYASVYAFTGIMGACDLSELVFNYDYTIYRNPFDREFNLH